MLIFRILVMIKSLFIILDGLNIKSWGVGYILIDRFWFLFLGKWLMVEIDN